GLGLILRRGAEGEPKETIAASIDAQLRIWRAIEKEAEGAAAPALLWPGRSALERSIEDLSPFDNLVTDRPSDVEAAAALGVDARCSERPFALTGVSEQYRKLCARRVWLPSGGFLVIDPCEAMTVIDVNTGKFVGSKRDREALFLKTNEEAARLALRLLRVRGVGGIILIDFIDMEREESRARLLSLLNELALRDPVKCVIHGFTSLGLLEMTRKKTEAPLFQPQFSPCPHCGGSGVVNEET
ncbi:MAG: ribonuclease E/G, partial [Clostridia bacterium]|nr:ribonuclease E/G [Clostridia bacterium]